MKSISKNILRDAEISACGQFRYWLSRVWDDTLPFLLYCCLNPSTADGKTDDASVRVMMGRARLLGYGGIIVVNLFAYRATNPKEMKAAQDPEGPDNMDIIVDLARKHKNMICAWGDDGEHKRRAEHLRATLINLDENNDGIVLWHLGLTRKRNPKHPLRIAYAVKPQVWYCNGLKPKFLKVEGERHGAKSSKVAARTPRSSGDGRHAVDHRNIVRVRRGPPRSRVD